MPAKLVTYNSQNYAGTLGSGLLCSHMGYIANNSCCRYVANYMKAAPESKENAL